MSWEISSQVIGHTLNCLMMLLSRLVKDSCIAIPALSTKKKNEILLDNPAGQHYGKLFCRNESFYLRHHVARYMFSYRLSEQ